MVVLPEVRVSLNSMSALLLSQVTKSEHSEPFHCVSTKTPEHIITQTPAAAAAAPARTQEGLNLHLYFLLNIR